jgi:diguanylate cyclase (GGDEF)-like protein
MKERILLVEDNKSLSKLIKRKMEESLDFEIIQSFSYEETGTLLEENDDYFIALLDLNLPDAPDGEVVDLVLSYNIPSIILTGTIDGNIREKMLKKDKVIDYVFKGNMDDVNYIFSLIQRLSKNRYIKLMVVDDSQMVRKNIKNILQKHMFKVLVAAHGEEALNYLETNNDVKLILTDYNMPVIDGIELTKKIREQFSKQEIAIISLTGSSEHLISAKFLKLGANDFITKPFSNEELICRINNTLEAQEAIEKLSTVANLDFLTNLYNRRYFFNHINDFIKKYQKYAIAMLDIDHFKKINDSYGHDAGDMVLKHLAMILKNNTKGSDIVARFGGEEFCIALADVNEKNSISFFVKLQNLISKERINIKNHTVKYTVSIGVTIKDKKEDIQVLLKEADKALYKAKEKGRNRVEIY